MSNVYTVNGTTLTNRAVLIEAAEGLHATPGMRGEDIEVPGAHGALNVHADSGFARRRHTPGRITFHLSVAGVDKTTGLPGVDPEDPALFLTRLDELVALFHARTLTIVHERDDGDRRCTARLAAPIQVVREVSSPVFGRLVADCTIPDGFWRDTTATTVSSGSVATGATVSLAALACTAPIADATVTFGPAANPMLQVGGSYVQYNGTISSGRQLEVFTGGADGWDLDIGSGTSWTPSVAAIAYQPGPSWLEIDATASPLQATFTHTGGGTATVSIAAYRKWLTS